jgi:hypothetical protein
MKTREQIIKNMMIDGKISALEAREILRKLRKNVINIPKRKYPVIDRQHESINPLEFI